MTEPAVLELLNISKTFGALKANDDITLRLAEGEILALLGENGAGKTTLMSILFGHYTPDEGEVRVRGHALPPGRPRAAIRAGIGMVHQHFALAPNLTVLENVMVGTEPLFRLRSDRAEGRARLERLSQRFGLEVDPDKRVSDLSVGECQRVEILKALYNDASILILDEPTAVLTQQEAEGLYATLKDMARQGLSLIFISHKLHEVMGAADRVVVLRRGRVVAERRTAETSRGELAELMVGQAVARPHARPATPGAVVAEGAGLVVTPPQGVGLRGADFRLHAGETLGIIGVSGNGQAALAGLIAGTQAPEAGSLTVLGRAIQRPDVRAMVAAGVGRIPEDRHAEGTIGDMTIWENAVIERLRTPAFSRRGIVRRDRARDHATRIIEEFDLRGGTTETRARLLSGGNMQKLILGRNLIAEPKIILAAQPGRGLDEGAVAAVHTRLIAARDRGAGVLLISEDLDEVMALADRVQAIVGGRLSPSIPTARADARLLGLMMAGDWQRAGEIAAEAAGAVGAGETADAR